MIKKIILLLFSILYLSLPSKSLADTLDFRCSASINPNSSVDNLIIKISDNPDVSLDSPIYPGQKMNFSVIFSNSRVFPNEQITISLMPSIKNVASNKNPLTTSDPASLIPKPTSNTTGTTASDNIQVTIPQPLDESLQGFYIAQINFPLREGAVCRTTNEGLIRVATPPSSPTPTQAPTLIPAKVGFTYCDLNKKGQIITPTGVPPTSYPKENIGILSAIGCVPTDPAEFIKGFLRFIVQIAGGIALLIMFASVFKIITSQGNEKSLHEGQQQLSSAIIGLLFIIFSVLLLKVIGVDILNIPGFQ